MSLVTRLRIVIVVLCAVTAAAQEAPSSQPPIWSTKPDVAAFDKIENEHLAAAQRAIDAVVAVKGTRTIANTLAPFDEAVRQINSASYFADLMQQVNPDAAFRDNATEMSRKSSAVQRRFR